jgi:hypothetical protein
LVYHYLIFMELQGLSQPQLQAQPQFLSTSGVQFQPFESQNIYVTAAPVQQQAQGAPTPPSSSSSASEVTNSPARGQPKAKAGKNP